MESIWNTLRLSVRYSFSYFVPFQPHGLQASENTSSSFALHTFRSNINSRQMMGWLIVLWLSEEHLYPFMSLIRRCFLHKRSEAGSTRCALSLGYSSGRTMGYPVDFLSGIPILTLSSRHLINCRLVKSLDLLKCLPRNLSKGKYVTRRVESKATFQQAP